MRRAIVPRATLVLLSLAALVYACGDAETADTPSISTGEDGGSQGVSTTSEGTNSSGIDGASIREGGSDAVEPLRPVDGSGLPDSSGVPDSAALEDADAAVEDPGPPRVRFVGRWDRRNVAGPRAGFPGARIIAAFHGTSVSVTLAEVTGFSGGPSVFDVIVDGVLRASGPLLTDVGLHDYALAADLAPGAHTVELYKRTETSFGVSQFIGFDFGVGGTLLPPPKARPHRIEFLGNSTTVGFGIEGAGPSCDGGAPRETHNARVGLMGLLEADLDADVLGIGYSGKGLIQNESPTDTRTFDILYPRTLADDVTSAWDFSEFTPDAVFVMLGGTDFSQQRGDFVPTPYDAFVAKFITLFDGVRAHYPKAHVFCAISPQAKDNQPAGTMARTNLKNACSDVVAHRAAANDNAFHVFEFAQATTDETGCYYHPNPALTRQMADQVGPFIKTTLGW